MWAPTSEKILMNKEKVILITGASSGIGQAAAALLLKKGQKVYGAARRMERMHELELLGMTALRLDITEEASCEKCISEVLRREGRIDVLINNAGYGYYAPVECSNLNEVRRQLDVNLIGLSRMVKLVLPTMRGQGEGRIINVSSMAGRMHTAYGAWYHATKFALEGWSDCLRMELRPFGIKVTLIEPGIILTPWGSIAAQHLENCTVDTEYEASARRVASTMKNFYGGTWGSSPQKPARAIVKAALAKYPRKRYLVGFLSSTAVAMRQILPTSLYDNLVAKIERM